MNSTSNSPHSDRTRVNGIPHPFFSHPHGSFPRFPMPSRPCCLFLLFLLLGLVSCGGGGSASQPVKIPPIVPPPTGVSVLYSPSVREATISWAQPTSTVDGFVIESRLQGQEFKAVNDTLIPSSYNSAVLTLSAPPAELAVYEFRMRSAVGETFSVYSNSTSFTAPPVPPGRLTLEPTSDAKGILLSWYQSSRVATATIIERTITDTKGRPLGEWQQLANVPTTVHTFTDSRIDESVNYCYRATNSINGLSSEAAVSEVHYIPPFPPADFAGSPEDGAVRLSWINQSKTATQIQILRTPVASASNEVLASLGPGETSFLDTNLRPGVYSYRIRVTDDVIRTMGGATQASPLNPPNAPVMVGTILPQMPYNLDSAFMTPSGAWFYGSSSSQSLSVFPHHGAHWEASNITDAALSGGRFTDVDPLGFPHLVFGSKTSATPIPSALVHSWFDGQGWRSENITDYDGSGSGYAPQICTDPTGAPRVVASGGLASSNWSSLRYFARIGETWVSEPLGPSLGGINGWIYPHFSLDPGGHPHLMLALNDSLVELNRSSEGVWTSLPVTDDYFKAGLNPGSGLWSDRDNGWYFFRYTAPSSTDHIQIRAKAKVDGLWRPSILIDACGSLRAYDVAISQDGSRKALLLDTDRGRLLYMHTASGWVGSTLPAGVSYSNLLRLRFDGSGKLHIFLRDTATTHWHE